MEGWLLWLGDGIEIASGDTNSSLFSQASGGTKAETSKKADPISSHCKMHEWDSEQGKMKS